MTYTFTCSQGHEPKSFTVEADNDDEALAKIMEKAAPHLQQAHPDMANMPPEEAKKIITGAWTKS
ncbi:hypothetical protein HYU92_06825 [Candidatus Curtissbacteria bacterium]|nr:hypothetical protein [Candidatus Curtissbacteria bacterium]